jgi:hypothetical protein
VIRFSVTSRLLRQADEVPIDSASVHCLSPDRKYGKVMV